MASGFEDAGRGSCIEVRGQEWDRFGGDPSGNVFGAIVAAWTECKHYCVETYAGRS
ncbi:unnamed protein product [Linum tenue]|uniref:Uncharacterized protein n=1 Tax=Linum tenue TaxID=586396 RepID=A0AAV0RHE2_9ROSI|nr:unnamed protein product [Linum tenue]